MISNKAIKRYFTRYFTRKDCHHRYYYDGKYYKTYSNAKSTRKTANQKVRRYNGKISNGSCYKKIYDVEWELF